MSQRLFTDYANLGDSGTDSPDAIQPVLDGQPGTQSTFQRPSENLRSRTEITRDAHRAHWYARDFSMGAYVIEGATGHSITWPGPTTAPFLSTGIVAVVGDLTIRPVLTPRVSTKGVLTVGVPASNTVRYETTATGYASKGQDQVFVEHRDTLAAVLSCNISVGPVKRILVVFDSTNPAHIASAVVAVVGAAIAIDPDLGVGVNAPYFKATTTIVGGPAVSAVAETLVEGTADQEAHRLVSGDLTAFTTANPLQEGDAVGVWYSSLVEEPPGVLAPGGRWESNPDRGTSTVPFASYFITSNNPQKIPGAIALFKVVNGELVWFTGDRFLPGTAGPIGSISGGLLLINDLPFSGAPTNSTNGGIDKPLPSPTVQNALNSVDVRLGQLRTAWTCTDGVSTTGGHFTGPSAIQNAITALAGLPGTILARRGTYTIPNAYAIPPGVVIRTDGAVIIQQAASISLSIGNNCELYGLSLNVNFTQITTGINVVMDRVSITGRLQVGSEFHGTYILVNGAAFATGYSVVFTGFNAYIEKLVVTSSVDIGGLNNHIEDLQVTGSTSTLGSSLVRLSGTNGSISRLSITVTMTISAGTALLEITGFENSVDHFLTNTIGSPLTAGRYGVWLNGCSGASIRNATVFMGLGVPLRVAAATSFDIAQSVFLSTLGTEGVFENTGISGLTQRWVFTRCSFSQFTNTASTLMTLLASAPSRILFETCDFEVAKLTGYALRAQHVTFTNCNFAIKNPLVLGNPRLAGSVNLQTLAPLLFEGGCSLETCTIDGNDAEVNLDGPNPTFSAPLFATFEDTSLPFIGVNVSELHIVNINKHMNSVGLNGLIELRANARLDGLTTAFTATPAIQGGAALLENVVAIAGDRVEFSHYMLNSISYPSPATLCPIGLRLASSFLHVDAIRILSNYRAFILNDALSPASFLRVTRSQLGTASAGCSDVDGFPFPVGDFQTWANTALWVNNTGAGSMVRLLATGQQGVGFDQCSFRAIPVITAGANGLFNSLAPIVVANFRYTGCSFFIAGAPGTYLFANNVTFTGTVGAGNTWIYTGGAAGAPSFAAVINTW